MDWQQVWLLLVRVARRRPGTEIAASSQPGAHSRGLDGEISPAKTALYHPAAGQKHKASLPGQFSHHLQVDIVRGSGIVDRFARIALVHVGHRHPLVTSYIYYICLRCGFRPAPNFPHLIRQIV